jgi:ribosomal protein S27AE
MSKYKLDDDTLAYLLRADRPVLTKAVLAVIGVPPKHTDQEYARGYGVVSRLIARGWVVACPAEAGHVNRLSLTQEGKEVAEQLESEVKDIVAIYGASPVPLSSDSVLDSDSVAPRDQEWTEGSVAISPGRASRPSSPISKTPQKRIICDQCSESLTLVEAEDAYDEAGRVKCGKCGKDLTQCYLVLKDRSGSS